MTILLWGPPNDEPIADVREILERLGLPFVFVDQGAVLETEVELVVDGDVYGSLRSGRQALDLSGVTAAYLRPHSSQQAPTVQREGPGSWARLHAQEVDDVLLSWAELTPALVVNRPSAMAGNDSKPRQADVIRSYGFNTPDTLLTTDPDAARDFHATHEVTIYKSLSGVRSIVSRINRDDLERIGDVASCPTQFQEYVAGTDVRVHVVGEEVFACEIVSDAEDFRYAGRQGATAEMRPCELPADCAVRCRALSRGLGLTMAGIDLRRTYDGRWYCFEVNPMPAYTCFPQEEERPVAEALARLFAEGNEFRGTASKGNSAWPPPLG